MKKLINLKITLSALFLLAALSLHANAARPNDAKADTSIDPKKHPGPVDLAKHPEIMAKVKEDLKNGKIAFMPKNGDIDSTLDLSKHPELVKAIIKNPANWPVILKAYRTNNDTLTIQGKNKQVIRDILAYLVKKHVVTERGVVSDFLLTNKVFTVNQKTLPESMHRELKEKYIKALDYIIHYGNSEMKGKGIFQRRDNL